ncbi:TfoX/Sxy family protein [Nocardioides sp.]|uniref:TfoX/Sxy family protein n=1 Tax=Nocardioides sp. TaxID=35761 RepID=UPI002CBFFD9C|nr:TfoX/Sxy family protein [Nocardioides sp.]HXH78779.1 TfoX/Sxy family protein [Nocardioides sp.]
MAYDKKLAERIRVMLADEPNVSERTMFGGLAFLISGNMSVAARGRGDLLVRAQDEDIEQWVDGESVRPMEMRGSPLRGWFIVALDVVKTEEGLQVWVDRGVAIARSLPAK